MQKLYIIYEILVLGWQGPCPWCVTFLETPVLWARNIPPPGCTELHDARLGSMAFQRVSNSVALLFSNSFHSILIVCFVCIWYEAQIDTDLMKMKVRKRRWKDGRMMDGSE